VNDSDETTRHFPQAGVLAWRRRNDDLQILLISSRSGRRWVIPKGLIDPGETAHEAAARETREEAGVRGRLSDAPIGRYHYEKWGGVCIVDVFGLAVEDVLDDWPESESRRRIWLNTEQAADEFDEPDLAAIVRSLRRHLDC